MLWPISVQERWYSSSALSWWGCQSPVAHSCGLLNHLNSFQEGTFKLNTKFDVDLLLTQSFWIWQPHSTHAHSAGIHWPVQWMLIVHTCAFQSTCLGCQVALMPCKLFSLYWQQFNFFWTGLLGNRVAKEHICTTHVHEQTMWGRGGELGGGGKGGKIGTTVRA